MTNLGLPTIVIMDAAPPYSLYLKFLKPAEALPLLTSLESLGLACLGDERITDDFSIVHYHFSNDEAKKLVLHVEVEESTSERINISIYNGATLEVIRTLFSFLSRFDPAKTALIDQEIKNELYIKDMATFPSTAKGTNIPQAWIEATEKAATIPVVFDDFSKNTPQLNKRRALLGTNA